MIPIMYFLVYYFDEDEEIVIVACFDEEKDAITYIKNNKDNYPYDLMKRCFINGISVHEFELRK